MKVLAIVPSIYDTSPGQRYRIEQWEPLLREMGVELTYSSFETAELQQILHQNGNTWQKIQGVLQNINRRRLETKSLEGFDLVYVFREAALLGPAWFERRIARSGIPMIFDFDDAVFHAYRSPSNGYLSYLKFPNKTGEICRLSAHVMAGNQYLADYAGKFNDKVTIIPTTIDTEKYRLPEEKDAPETITIGIEIYMSFARIASIISRPFIPGIMKSVSTRQGTSFLLVISRRASAPLDATSGS